jgi:hypothetical protein
MDAAAIAINTRSTQNNLLLLTAYSDLHNSSGFIQKFSVKSVAGTYACWDRKRLVALIHEISRTGIIYLQ